MCAAVSSCAVHHEVPSMGTEDMRRVAHAGRYPCTAQNTPVAAAEESNDERGWFGIMYPSNAAGLTLGAGEQ